MYTSIPVEATIAATSNAMQKEKPKPHNAPFGAISPVSNAGIFSNMEKKKIIPQ